MRSSELDMGAPSVSASVSGSGRLLNGNGDGTRYRVVEEGVLGVRGIRNVLSAVDGEEGAWVKDDLGVMGLWHLVSGGVADLELEPVVVDLEGECWCED